MVDKDILHLMNSHKGMCGYKWTTYNHDLLIMVKAQ